MNTTASHTPAAALGVRKKAEALFYLGMVTLYSRSHDPGGLGERGRSTAWKPATLACNSLETLDSLASVFFTMFKVGAMNTTLKSYLEDMPFTCPLQLSRLPHRRWLSLIVAKQ